MSVPVRILLVEDDALIARERARHRRARGRVVHRASSHAASDGRLAADAVELIALDLGMPDDAGLDWLAHYRRINRTKPVPVSTARDGIAERTEALRGDADDCRTKPSSVDGLDRRVDALTRRGRKSGCLLVRFGRLSWLGPEGRVFVDGQALDLAPRNLPTRKFEGPGRLIRCAPRVWSERTPIGESAKRNLDVDHAAAEGRVSRLRRKFADSGTAIRTSRGVDHQFALERGATE